MSSLLLLTLFAAAPANPAASSAASASATRSRNVVTVTRPAPVGGTTAAVARSEGRTEQALLQAESNPAAEEILPVVGVPFACGARFPVSQGHDTGSHRSYDTHAWDFRMPEGTPITAARDGVVRLARGDSDQGGCDAKMARHANYVVITHDGGLETQYLHFSSVVVKPGDRVTQGQLIGYSGNTGWSCGPHLHFKVTTRENNSWNNPSLPALIEGHGDPVRGMLVEAPACAPLDAPRYAERERESSPVGDVVVGASLPDGPVDRPASALGGTAGSAARAVEADRPPAPENTRPASGSRVESRRRR
ncbi:MAG TPA: M23 family metallopeptidase [Myxococcaceae bacterium]|nr:M23 family metallopeptidase [Myxococcaceae bacterium]